MLKESYLRFIGFSAVAMFAFANVAAAEGVYVSLQGGYSFLQNSKIGGDLADSTTDPDVIELENSYLFGGSIGYDFKGPLRVEAAGTYQKFDVDKIRNDDTGVFESGTGDVSVVGVTINGFYDFKNPGQSLVPYIGAGIGAVYADINDIQRGSRTVLDENAYAPTGLGMVGVSYDLSKSVALSVGYQLQWIGVLDGSITRSSGASSDAETDQIFIHNVTAGLRITF